MERTARTGAGCAATGTLSATGLGIAGALAFSGRKRFSFSGLSMAGRIRVPPTDVDLTSDF